MDRGYLPVWRKLESNPVWEDNLMLAMWIRLLFKANHSDGSWWNGREFVKIEAGQFISSGPKLAEYLRTPRSTLLRKLKVFKKLGMLDIEVDNQYTTITICNYTDYQDVFKQRGQVNEQQVDNPRTGGGQAVDTSKELKELNELNALNQDPLVLEIVQHLNETLGTNYSHKTASTASAIKARLGDGYTLEDFKIVHVKKHSEWNGTEQQRYLRPSTLYRPSKFEEYLNQVIVEKKGKHDWMKEVE